MISQKSIILFLLLFLHINICALAQVQKVPVPKKGVLNLDGWDLETDGLIKIEGEWEFYWNQLLMPDDFNETGNYELTKYAYVPGYWVDYKFDGLVFEPKGYATYRLRVNQLSPNRIISLRLSLVVSAYNIYANGKLLAQCGKVATTEKKSKALVCPENLTFLLEKDSLELVLQVSNYHHPRAGIWSDIYLGSSKDIQTQSILNLALDLFLIGSIFIMALYHFGLFQLRVKEKSTLYFGLLCFFIALRTSFHNSVLFYVVFPDFPWDIYLKMDYSTLYLPAIVFLLFFRQLYPNEFSSKFIKTAIIVCLIFGLFTVVTSPFVFAQYLSYFQIVILILSAYSIIAIGIAYYRKRAGSGIVLGGVALLIVTVVNDILHAQSIINTMFVLHFGLLAFIFSQARVISGRFVAALDTAEVLSKRLEYKVTEQTAEIKDLLDNTGQGIFTFRDDMIIEKHTSKTTRSIFGKLIAGEKVSDFLHSNSDTPITDYFEVIFESNGKLNLVKDLLPDQIEQDGRSYEVAFRWIPEAATTPGRIMVILTDITVKRKLEKMLEKDQNRDRKIVRIAVDRYGFLRYYNSVIDQVTAIKIQLQSESPELTKEQLSQIIHTMKGGTSAYGLQKVSLLFHDFESSMEPLKETSGSLDEHITDTLLVQLEKIKKALEEELHEIGDLIPKELLQVSRTSFYTISELKVARVEELVQSEPESRLELTEAVNDLRRQPLRNLMKKLVSDGEELAYKSHKHVKISYSGERTQLIHKPFEELFNTFTHLVSNAVDHGIELPKDRLNAGKSEIGSLSIDTELQGNDLHFTFSDDGGGIAPNDVVEEALNKKIITSDDSAKLTDEESLNLIFKPGFSTKSELTLTSGRGYGMHAVYEAVRKLGGTIKIESVVNLGTVVKIKVPKGQS